MTGLDAYAGLTIVQCLELARLQRDRRVPATTIKLRLEQIDEQINHLPDSPQRAALSKRCADLLASLAGT